MISEAALNDAAKDVRHPSCCGRRMANRGRRAITVQGLDGPLRIRRTRYRCRTCGHESTPADGPQTCGRHRLTRPLAKRVCQLATVEHFTRLPQLKFDQHGVRLSHHEMLGVVQDVGGVIDAQRRAGCHAHIAKQDEHALRTCSICFDMLALLTRCKHGTQHVGCP